MPRFKHALAVKTQLCVPFDRRLCAANGSLFVCISHRELFSESFWKVCYCTTTAITFCLNIWLIKCHMSTTILYFLPFNQLECLDPTNWYAIICFIQCSDHATNELICIWHLFQFKIISKANARSSEHVLINNMVSYTYWKYIVMFESTMSLRTHKIKCKK